jgi:nitrate/nitrite transport system ATP-binding protein
MITHDVDEAILLADRILLMSNGPNACIAEVVENTLPRPRDRHNIHHDPQYYRVRNHLVDFLVNRSKLYQTGEAARPAQPRQERPKPNGNGNGNGGNKGGGNNGGGHKHKD